MVYESQGNEWARIPADPDPNDDLGYHIDDWDTIRANEDGRGQLMFLPGDEELLRDDAFILADPQSVCNVEHRQ